MPPLFRLRNEQNQWDEKGTRQYTEVYRGVMGSNYPTPLDVYNANGVPPMWSGKRGDPDAILRKKAARRLQIGTRVWECICSYSTKDSDEDENPLNRLPKYAWGSQGEIVYPVRDRDGKWFTNTAVEPYPSDVAATDQHRRLLTVVRNEPYFPLALADAYEDTVSTDPFAGYPAGRAKCATITGTGPEIENEVIFWIVTYEFHFSKLGWRNIQIDQGSYYWEDDENGVPQVGDPDSMKYPADADGTKSTAVVLLNGQGGKLSQADYEAKNVFWNVFRMYDEKPFSVFNL